MNDEDLIHLLRGPDRSDKSPVLDGPTLRHIAGRRATRPRRAGTALVLMLAAMGAILFHHANLPPSSSPTPPLVGAPHQRSPAHPVVPIDPEAGMSIHERIALEAQSQLDRRLLATLAAGYRASINDVRDESAQMMVLAAARRLELEQTQVAIDKDIRNQSAQIMVLTAAHSLELNDQQSAADLYTSAIAFFPETPAALIARDSLAELDHLR